MTIETNTRTCPACKEEIKANAVKCKMCGSRLSPERPPHNGVCPYCKEQIQPAAIKCKHCKSNLAEGGEEACGCAGRTARSFQLGQRASALSSVFSGPAGGLRPPKFTAPDGSQCSYVLLPHCVEVPSPIGGYDTVCVFVPVLVCN